VLGHLVFLVSGSDLPVEAESLPLHVVGHEPPAQEREVARLVAARPALTTVFGGWMASLHPTAWQEVEAMARAKGQAVQIDMRPVVEMLGVKRVIEQVGLERVIEQVGLERVIKEVGVKAIVEKVGVEEWLANLSPAARRQVKRRLAENS
jgi:hypothetical protein